MARKSREPCEALLGGEDWKRIWPALAEHLHRVLGRRVPAGIDPADLVQETAFRILRSAKTFADLDHVAKEATRIAINLATDARRRSRLVTSCPLPENIAAHDNVEGQVLLAEQLASLQRHAALKSVDLHTLVDPSSDPHSRTEAAKSRRYRARKLLREWREAGGAALALPKLRWVLSGAAAATIAAGPLLPLGPQLAEARPSPTPAGPAHRLAVALDQSVKTVSFAAAAPTAPLISARSTSVASASESPIYRSQIELRGPAGTSVEKGTREYPPEDQPTHLVCVRQERPTSEFCVPHPLRQ